MNAIREPRKINEDTTLIDFGMRGVAGFGGVYLVEAGKSCLIDAGTKEYAKNIVRYLRDTKKGLPDYVLLSHSHYDHSQGVHSLRKFAAKENHKMEILASEPAIPLLEDQSFNQAFYPKEEFENILDATPLSDGATLDLDGITLRMTYLTGHCKDQIAILDEQNKNLFVGDALGIILSKDTIIPSIMPPFWDTEAYLKSAAQIGQIEYDTLSLAHFGCILSPDAQSIPEESASVCKTWWGIFQSAEEQGKLDDIEYLLARIPAETGMKYPEIKLLDSKLKYGLKILNATRRIRGKQSLLAAEIFMRDLIVPWMVKAYKIHTGA
ncbi:MAG: MBL fold metallo-hydrolase [Candidatus Thorarchaeota archaeon]|jgi:glyoxylase-like metal-dependent hydrolase (beta-lactamase superfamily II)